MRNEEPLVSFENDYLYEDENNNTCVSIDGFPADEDAEGEVVAEVFLTPHQDFVVAWHDNRYRGNEHVQNLIEESKKILLQPKS